MGDSKVYYLPTGKEVEVFEKSYENRLPVLLKGPTGVGKSRFVHFMAQELGRELITVACHEETSATDLIGRYLFKGGETVWVDGPLTKAVRDGQMIYLDEIAEARPDIIVAIHSLTDFRRQLYLDKLGTSLEAHPDFILIASFNPGYQKGFKELKPSTRQRFVALSFEHPSVEQEIEILVHETGIEDTIAKKMVNLANKIRNLTELGLTETVSTRLLVDAALLINSGLGPRLSIRVAVIEPLSDDPDILNSLVDLAGLIL